MKRLTLILTAVFSAVNALAINPIAGPLGVPGQIQPTVPSQPVNPVQVYKGKFFGDASGLSNMPLPTLVTIIPSGYDLTNFFLSGATNEPQNFNGQWKLNAIATNTSGFGVTGAVSGPITVPLKFTSTWTNTASTNMYASLQAGNNGGSGQTQLLIRSNTTTYFICTNPLTSFVTTTNPPFTNWIPGVGYYPPTMLQETNAWTTNAVSASQAGITLSNSTPYFAGGGSGLSNVVATATATNVSWSSVTGKPSLATNTPTGIANALGFTPATNSFSGVTNALGFGPATNGGTFVGTYLLTNTASFAAFNTNTVFVTGANSRGITLGEWDWNATRKAYTNTTDGLTASFYYEANGSYKCWNFTNAAHADIGGFDVGYVNNTSPDPKTPAWPAGYWNGIVGGASPIGVAYATNAALILTVPATDPAAISNTIAGVPIGYFGATGSGTDETVAISNAFASGTHVWIPRTTNGYLAGNLVVGNNTFIDSDGAEIKFSPYYSNAFVSAANATNFQIKHLTFNGLENNMSPATKFNNLMGGSFGAPGQGRRDGLILNAQPGRWSEVAFCTVKGFNGAAVLFTGSANPIANSVLSFHDNQLLCNYFGPYFASTNAQTPGEYLAAYNNISALNAMGLVIGAGNTKIYGWMVNSNWWACWLTNDPGGNNLHGSANDCTFNHNHNGIVADNTGSQSFDFENCQFFNDAGALYSFTNASGIRIANSVFGGSEVFRSFGGAGHNYLWNNRYGGAWSSVSVTNDGTLDIRGNSSWNVTNALGNPDTDGSFYGSNGLAPTAITFPASTVQWTNPIRYAIDVYVDNSGVTGTAVSKNGQQIFSTLSTNLVIGLQGGEYFSETYSAGTPSARWSPRQ